MPTKLKSQGIIDWIESRYGPINFDGHRFYFIASVPLFNQGTAAAGVGASVDEAVENLMKELRGKH